jgi:hypothetical protein
MLFEHPEYSSTTGNKTHLFKKFLCTTKGIDRENTEFNRYHGKRCGINLLITLNKTPFRGKKCGV